MGYEEGRCGQTNGDRSKSSGGNPCGKGGARRRSTTECRPRGGQGQHPGKSQPNQKQRRTLKGRSRARRTRRCSRRRLLRLSQKESPTTKAKNEGRKRARTLRRLTEDKSHDVDLFRELRGLPWDMRRGVVGRPKGTGRSLPVVIPVAREAPGGEAPPGASPDGGRASIPARANPTRSREDLPRGGAGQEGRGNEAGGDS